MTEQHDLQVYDVSGFPANIAVAAGIVARLTGPLTPTFTHILSSPCGLIVRLLHKYNPYPLFQKLFLA